MDHKFFYRLLCLVGAAVLTGYMYLAMLGSVPLFQLNTSLALGVFLILFWTARLFWKRVKPTPSKAAGEWLLLDPLNSYAFYASTIWTTWSLGPFLPSDVQLACIFVLLMCAVVIILGSTRFAPAHGFGAVSPLAIPVSTLLFILVHLEIWKWGIAAAFTISSVALFVFRRVMQGLLNSAHFARLEAERERDAKNRFIASASHDLQQPIQAAGLSFDQVISRKGEAREKAVRRVRWALDTTGQLLKQMTEYLQLQAGELAAKRGDIAIGPAIARAAELYEPAATASGIQIHAMPSGLETIGDPSLVDRILANYITNGIKHSKASRLLVGARRRGDRIRIWVIDDGLGIDAVDQPQLFDDYFQGANHRGEERGGFGLGLASAMRMAKLMGGDAGYEKRWASGSAFWFELPVT